MSLVINLATRGRPELLAVTIQRTLSNISRDDTRLVVSVDSDDRPTLTSIENGQLLGGSLSALPVVWNIADREMTLGAKYNRALLYPADVYLVMVDYAPHVTPGFDQKILDAAAVFPDGVGVVYNTLANASFPQINAVTRKWVELTGYIYPPYWPYWFIDHWLDDVARITDRISCADVRINTSARQAEPGTPWTQGLRDLLFWSNYFELLRPVRDQQALKIIDTLDEPEWRKTLLRDRRHLVHQRSQWVSSTVDAQAAAIEGEQPAPASAHYRRTKQHAERHKALIQERLTTQLAA